MKQMLFKDVGGIPVPMPLRATDGSTRAADNKNVFDAKGATAHFGKTARQLAAIWESMREEFEQDVSPVLEAGPPDVAVKLEAAPDAGGDGPALSREQRLLWRIEYPHLMPDEFEHLLAICRQRRLNPWSRHLRVDVEADSSGKRSLLIITTIDALRLIAQRTGEYAGQTEPQWCGPDFAWRDLWPDDQIPFAAKVGVERRGSVMTFWGKAHWKDFARLVPKEGGGQELDEFWARMPRHMIAKVAEALALRKAFAEELDGIFSFEEMRGRAERTTRTSPAPVAPAPDRYVESQSWPADDTIPESDAQFEHMLSAIGFDAPGRAKLLTRFHESYPGLYDCNAQAFYNKVLYAVRQNPAAYGARPPRSRVRVAC